MKKFAILFSLIATFTTACDTETDTEIEPREMTLEGEAPDIQEGHANWDDIQSINLDGGVYEVSCRDRGVGESWVDPGCFACFCGDDGMATCYLAACVDPVAEQAHADMDGF